MFSLFLAVTLFLPQILASMGETRKDFLRSASSFSYFLALCFISAFPKFIQNRSLQRKCGRTEVAAFVSHTRVPPPAAPDWHCVIPFNLLLLDARSQDCERLRVVAQVCWWEAKWFSGWFSPAREQSLGVAKVSHRGYMIKYKLWLKTTFGLEKQRHESNSLEQRMYCCHPLPQFCLSLVMATLLYLRHAQFFLCPSYDHFKLHLVHWKLDFSQVNSMWRGYSTATSACSEYLFCDLLLPFLVDCFS